MSAPLYNTEILRLATSVAGHRRLVVPDGTAEERSSVCGSRVTVDVCVDADGCLSELGMDVRSCALGQASAALMGAHAAGRSLHEMETAATALRKMLGGDGNAGFWPGMDVLARARDYPARHAAILLPFDAATKAMRAVLKARAD